MGKIAHSRSRGRFASRYTEPNLKLGVLPKLVGYHVRRAQVRAFVDFSRSMSQYQITPGQFGVLQLIKNNPGVNQSALARAFAVERSTMVAVINILEKRGLIQRAPSQKDRRSYDLTINPSAAATLQDMERQVIQHDQRLSSDLTRGEKEQLINMLNRLS